ncbi:hypothetical protein RRG08_001507 [Elysia crispata]|uniref:Uncharacterized protein n=1 Tax=Elysia crispata TaxID=231223 RepID=A0AAE1DV80_9GAST|nr:hypothetical protein RRG08_001507 [Elysia crispata]
MHLVHSFHSYSNITSRTFHNNHQQLQRHYQSGVPQRLAAARATLPAKRSTTLAATATSPAERSTTTSSYSNIAGTATTSAAIKSDLAISSGRLLFDYQAIKEDERGDCGERGGVSCRSWARTTRTCS